PEDPIWLQAKNALHRFRHTERIVNIAGGSELKGEIKWSVVDIRLRYPTCVVVHGPLELSDVQFLRDSDGTSSSIWRSNHVLESSPGSEVYFHRFFGVGRAN